MKINKCRMNFNNNYNNKHNMIHSLLFHNTHIIDISLKMTKNKNFNNKILFHFFNKTYMEIKINKNN